MATTNIGDALRQLFNEQQWSKRIYSRRLQNEWETIMGKTIAKHTHSLWLSNKTLNITTHEAILRHELQIMKLQLIDRINEYFEEDVVNNVIIK